MSFNRTGVLRYKNNEPYFAHIGINPKFRHMYGVNDNEKICSIEFEIDVNQELAHTNEKPDYWGWLKTGNNEEDMTMIYPSFAQFSMCFPYGVDVEERNGYGKKYRLRIKNFEEI